MLLIGSLPQPISSAPIVILLYVVLILMVGSALASVLLRNLLYAVGAFAGTMLLVAILYLMIAPVLLFGFQLLVFTTVSATLLIGLLRQSSGLTASRIGPLSREWVIGAGVAAALFALLGVVLAVTNWPVRTCCALPASFTGTLSTTYVVGIWTLAILLGSAALGSGLLLASSTVVTRTRTPSPTHPTRGREFGGRGRRR